MGRSVTEYFIRNSDNEIRLTLTEDKVPISGAWTALDIFIGGVAISRSADGDGVSLSTSTGVLSITPADLLEAERLALDALAADTPYRVEIVVTSSTNDDGIVFGAAGQTRILFHVSDKPVAV